MRTPFLISSDASASAGIELPPGWQGESAHSVSIIVDSAVLAQGAADSAGRMRAAMTFDAKAYLHHLDGMDISEAEKAEFIHTLWLIAQCFVDDAYSARTGVDGSQLKSGFEAANVVSLPPTQQTRAKAANDNQKEPDARRKKA